MSFLASLAGGPPWAVVDDGRAQTFLCINQCNRWHSRSQYCTSLHLEHFLSGFSSPHELHSEIVSWKPRCPLMAALIISSALAGFSLLASCVTTCRKTVHSRNGNSRTHSRIVASTYSREPSLPAMGKNSKLKIYVGTFTIMTRRRIIHCNEKRLSILWIQAFQQKQ